MRIFDTHCDTLCRIADEGGGLYKNTYHLDISRMRGCGAYAQVFACFISDEEPDPRSRLRQLVEVFDREMRENAGYIVRCGSFDDYEKAVSQGKCAAFLSLENARGIESWRDAEFLAENGFIMASLTWNGENRLARGADIESGGLTALGKELVKELNGLGIAVDVSHLNERSFWDVTDAARIPACASHSNLKPVCRHRRNLSKEQFSEIVSSGGYAGLNFYPPFLANSGKAGVEDIIKMAEKAIELGGKYTIGFGSDFDGVDFLPEEIAGVQSISTVLKRFKEKELCKNISHGNFERYLKRYR